MYPNQPQQFPAPPGNPYEFILNPNEQKKRLGRTPGSNPFIFKLVMIIGGAIILVIILAIAASLLKGNGGGLQTTQLISLAQTQTEIIRISHEGTQSATRQTTKNLSVTAQLSVQTQQRDTLALLERGGYKVDAKELKLKQDAKTDQEFATAKQTSSFDTVYATEAQAELEAYASSIKQIFNASTNKAERDLMGRYYEETQLLITQIPYTQQAITSSE